MYPQCSGIALPPQLSCQQHVASGYCSWCTVHLMWWEKNAIWYLWSALFSTVVQNMTGVFHEQDVVRCYCPGPGVSQVQSNFHVSKYISFHSPSSLPHHITTSQLLQLSTLAHTWAFRHDALVWVAAAPGANHGMVTRHVSCVGRCSGWRIRYSHCRNHLPAFSQIYKWRQHHKCAYSTKLAAQNLYVCPSFVLRSLANKTSVLL